MEPTGINSEELFSPAYGAWQADTANRVVVPTRQAGNRFLGSLKRLQIQAQLEKCGKFKSGEAVISFIPLAVWFAVFLSVHHFYCYQHYSVH
jgi:hypothetical protein